jgi:hypothetical protein
LLLCVNFFKKKIEEKGRSSLIWSPCGVALCEGLVIETRWVQTGTGNRRTIRTTISYSTVTMFVLGLEIPALVRTNPRMFHVQSFFSECKKHGTAAHGR